MRLIYKDKGIVVNTYGMKNNKCGYPMFLIYRNDQWVWKSAKYFEPYNCINENDKTCYNCRNNSGDEPPHTCDICTSLDNDEDYTMWEPIV